MKNGLNFMYEAPPGASKGMVIMISLLCHPTSLTVNVCQCLTHLKVHSLLCSASSPLSPSHLWSSRRNKGGIVWKTLLRVPYSKSLISLLSVSLSQLLNLFFFSFRKGNPNTSLNGKKLLLVRSEYQLINEMVLTNCMRFWLKQK